VEPSFHDSDPLGLRFDSVNDQRDEFREVVQHYSDVLSAKDSVAERYAVGGLEVCLEFRASPHGSNLHFVFNAVPDRLSGDRPEPFCSDDRFFNTADSDGWNYRRVLIHPSHSIQSPQGMIPSLVWLAWPDDRPEFLGNAPSETGFKFLLSATEGEVTIAGLRVFPGRDGHRVNSMVKRSPKIRENVTHPFREILRELPLESYLDKGHPFPIRVWLSEWLVSAVATEEDTELPIEYGSVFLRPCDLAARTGEGV
jgi:hypothetical protein